MNSREETLVELLERRFVDADGYIKWDDQVKGLIATHQFRSPDMAFCHCSNDEKHGQTSVMCCNHCGLPDEEFWKRPEPPDMAEALREIRNRLYDSLPTGEIDANASWEMLQSIKRHVGELDNFCASLSSPGRGWVKVEDGLPKIPPPYFENGVKLTPLSCRVIVYDSVLKEVYEADYYDGRFDNNNPDITYWQPLPTPPNP